MVDPDGKSTIDYSRTAAAFDDFAPVYDDGFRSNPISTWNRQRFWKVVEKNLDLCAARLLDFGCGTGEDALHFGNLGHEVVGIDLSPEMIRIARQKIGPECRDRVRFAVGDEENLSQLVPSGFSLAYANFGSLNFVKDLSLTGKRIHDVLLPGGKFVAVIQNRFCLQESLYFALTGRLARATRRWPGVVDLRGSGKHPATVMFYRPTDVIRLLRPMFHILSIQSWGTLGFVSFLYEEIPRILTRAQPFPNKVEDALAKVPVLNRLLAGLGDFFVLVLEARA